VSTSTIAKAAFKTAWATLRAELTEADIALAHEITEASTEALARYQRRRPV
jgi:hypothetical protein